jgi:predicted small metal-binding protein
MARRSLAILFAIVLTLALTSLVLAQDAAKSDMKKESPKAMSMGPLKSVTCDPTCGFMVRSHDEKELTSIVIAHAKKYHNKKVTAKDVKAMMKTEDEMKKD